MKTVIAIDPGNSGAILVTDGVSYVEVYEMPTVKESKSELVEFKGVLYRLKNLARRFPDSHVFLERAMPAAMGSKHAFNYGRGFEALTIAVALSGLPCTLVEPSKWAKEMHEGISTDLKPKAKSLIAVNRLFPRLVKSLPRKPKAKTLHDGPVDALLIAGYGLRRLGRGREKSSEDFY